MPQFWYIYRRVNKEIGAPCGFSCTHRDEIFGNACRVAKTWKQENLFHKLIVSNLEWTFNVGNADVHKADKDWRTDYMLHKLYNRTIFLSFNHVSDFYCRLWLNFNSLLFCSKWDQQDERLSVKSRPMFVIWRTNSRKYELRVLNSWLVNFLGCHIWRETEAVQLPFCQTRSAFTLLECGKILPWVSVNIAHKCFVLVVLKQTKRRHRNAGNNFQDAFQCEYSRMHNLCWQNLLFLAFAVKQFVSYP